MDTGLSNHPSLKGLWTDLSKVLWHRWHIVVGFDLFKHGLTHLDARYDTLAVDALASQAVEEALRADVVV